MTVAASHPIRVLHVEDNLADVELVEQQLEDVGSPFAVEHAASLAGALDAIAARPPDIVLLDLSLPDATDFEALDALQGRYPSLPVVVFTGLADEKRATAALGRGAQDYVVKNDSRADALARSIRYACERKRGEERLRDLAGDLARRVAEGNAQQERIEFLNRVLRVRSEVNRLIVREPDRDRLLRETCRVAVEVGGFRFAWIGAAAPGGRLDPIAWAGDEGWGLTNGEIRRDVGAPDPDPAGRAVFEGQTIASPIRQAGRVTGSLSLLAGKPFAFGADAVALVEATAADLGFALGALEDQRARREAEAREQARAKELEAVLDAVPVAVLITHDAGCGRIHGNAAAEALFGVAPGGILSRVGSPTESARSRLLRDGVDLTVDELPLHRCAATGLASRDLEVDVLREDGVERHLVGNVAPLLDPDGNPRGAVAAFLDVTESRRSEIAIREAEQRFRLVLENMPVLLAAFDDEGRHIFWNRECEALTGFAASEIVGNPAASEILFPDPRHRDRAREAIAGKTDDFRGRDLPIACRDGSRRIISWSHVGSRVSVPGWASWLIGVDVTALRATETSMRRVSQAIEQADEAIVITDAQGRIEYVNPAACRVSEYEAAELLGQRPSIFTSGEHGRAFYEDLWRTIRSGETWRGAFVNRTKSGARFEEAAVIAPVRDEHGEIVSFVSVKRDLARENQLEGQLRQAQKLEAVGQLAGGVAHDFNNALSGVIGYCDLALAEATTAPLPEYLREIRKAGDRAASIARQLLVFSRRQMLDLRVADVNQVVEGIAKMLKRLIGETTAIEVSLAPDIALAHLDVGQVEQILTNLCLNARDAMPEGGRVTITTANVAATEVPPLAAAGAPSAGAGSSTWIRLSVADTGTGMSDEVRAHLFEPFFTTKAAGKGTGLGLAVVHGIVAKHGGAIALDSVAGKGTTFRIYLPASREAKAGQTAPAQGPLPRGTETVLVTDDDELVRRVTGRLLEQLGYRVLIASSGYEAIGFADQAGAGIDLLLTDVVMPGLDGKGLSEVIAKKCPSMRILFMSGHVPERLGDHGFPALAGAYLPKPFSAMVLAARVREALDAPAVATPGAASGGGL